jgi:hypothetical protein
LSIGAICWFRPLGGMLDRKCHHHSIVRPRFPILAFNTNFLFYIHRSKVMFAFWFSDYGGMSIWAARGHLKPVLTSSVCGVTMVYYSRFGNIFRLSCTVSTVKAVSLWLEMENFWLRPLGGLLDRKWHHYSNLWLWFVIGWPLEFSSVSHRSEVFRLFRFALKMLSENVGEGIVHPVKFFSMTPPIGTSLGYCASNEVYDIKIG